MDTTTKTASEAQEAVRSAYTRVRRALDSDLAQAGEALTRRDLGALAARVTKTLRGLGTQLAVDVAFGVPAPCRGRLAAVLILIEQVAHELGRLPLEVEPEPALALDQSKPPGTPLPEPSEEHWKERFPGVPPTPDGEHQLGKLATGEVVCFKCAQIWERELVERWMNCTPDSAADDRADLDAMREAWDRTHEDEHTTGR